MKTYQRPNVLIIYTDQQRLDSLGCYNKYAKTPNIDKLAKDGTRLDNFFVNNPVCMPSRMSMLTSRYPASLGIGANGTPFPDDAVPVNQILKPYGYHTSQIGKLHFDPHSHRDHRNPTKTYGFDTFILSDEPGCYDDAYIKWIESIDEGEVKGARSALPPAAYHYKRPEYSTVPRNTHEPYVFESAEEYTHSGFVASETCRYIKKHSSENFFAIAGFYAPHTPVNPPQRFVDMYDIDNIPLPVLGEEDEISPKLKDVTKEKWKEIIGYYLALVTHVDECVGQIIDTLKKEGVYDNTLIIFTSDHGEYLGDHGRIQKGHPHDCILNVPCIITCPDKIRPGSVITQLVEAVDLVPTILDFCGVQIPDYMQGKSIKNLILGKTDVHREDVFSHFFEPDCKGSCVLRTNTHKYVIDNNENEILYDLENDPGELKNVAANPDYAKVLADLRKRMTIRLLDAHYRRKNRVARY